MQVAGFFALFIAFLGYIMTFHKQQVFFDNINGKTFALPSKCKPREFPRTGLDNAARLVSKTTYLYTFNGISNRIIYSSNVKNAEGANNRKWALVEEDRHYILNYGIVNLYNVYDEKYRFHSVMADMQDGNEYSLSNEVYNEVIFLQCAWREFGHHIHDGIISCLFALPKEIVKRSMLAIRFNMDLSKKFINLLGIEHGPILDMKEKTGYLCKTLHVVEPGDTAAAQLYATRLAVEQYRKNLQLDKIKPSIGLFNNRDRNHPRGRHVLNFDEIVSAVQEKYSNETFIVMQSHEMENLNYSVKLFAAAKFFIVTVGSGPINVIFMKPGTGISILGSNNFDVLVLTTCSALGVWTTYCSNSNLIHFPNAQQKHANISVETNMKYIDRMIYAVRHQCWPQLEKDMIVLWDYQHLAKYHGVNIPSS